MAAESSDIGTLVMRIKGDITDLENKLNRANTGAKNFAKVGDEAANSHSASSRRIVAVWAAVAVAVVTALNKANNAIQDTLKLAATMGVSATKVSVFTTALKLQGVAFSDVAAASSHWAQVVQDLENGSVSPATQTIKQLGIEVRNANGTLKTFDQVWPSLVSKLSQYQDSTNKTIAGTNLLGESYSKMVLAINAGPKALDDMMTKAKQMEVFTQEGIERAKQYEEATNQLSVSWEKFSQIAVIKVAPALKSWLDNIMLLIDNYDKFKKIVDDTQAMDKYRAQLREVDNQAKNLANPHTGFWSFLNTDEQQHAAALERLRDLAKEVDRIRGVSSPSDQGFSLGVTDKAREFLKLPPVTTKAWQVAVTPEFNEPTGGGKMKAPASPVEAIKNSLDEIQDKLQGMPVLLRDGFTFDTRPFEQAYDILETARENDVISTAQANKMKLGLQRQEQQAMLDTASLAASTITQVFGDNKAAAAASAVINTAVGVTKALSGSVPPFNFIQAGLVATAGAAQLATILSATEDGGGAIPAVPAASAPSAPAAPEAAPQQRELFVQGISPKDIFTGDVVAGLAQQLVDFQRDGGQVVIGKGGRR